MLDHQMLYACTSESDLLVQALDRFPERIAFHTELKEITYRELAEEISRYTQVLRHLGVAVGDRVGILSGNRIEVIYINYALAMLGCCLVPLHPKGSLRDHEYVLDDARLDGLVFDGDIYSERAGSLKEAGLPGAYSLGKAPDAQNLIELAAGFSPERLNPPRLPPDTVCRLSYSGGTTGVPKAIMGTPLSLLTKTMIQLVEWQWPDNINQLLCAPLSHAGGAMVLPTLIRGGTLRVLDRFDARMVMETIERHRINCMLMVPTMINSLLDHPELQNFDLGSLETIFYGAAPMAPQRLKQGIELLGQVFFQFYGQTESPLTVAVMRKEEHDIDDPDRLSCCGRPVPWIKVALLDDSGIEVADGEPGEICVQGPLVMKGYWGKPEQTSEVLKNGWLHTGDMAVRRADGFLKIVDRKKDMIITGGFNVFAREVEDVICGHPAVDTCAVYGMPDERWGEAVAVSVVLKPGREVCPEELIMLVKDAKGAVQAPKLVRFTRELLLTSLGKPDKKALKIAHCEDLATSNVNGAGNNIQQRQEIQTSD